MHFWMYTYIQIGMNRWKELQKTVKYRNYLAVIGQIEYTDNALKYMSFYLNVYVGADPWQSVFSGIVGIFEKVIFLCNI